MRGPLEALSRRTGDAAWFFAHGTLLGRPGYHKDNQLGKGIAVPDTEPDPDEELNHRTRHLYMGGKLHGKLYLVGEGDVDLSVPSPLLTVCGPRGLSVTEVQELANTWYPGCAERVWESVAAGGKFPCPCDRLPGVRTHWRLTLR